jgi:hypothetical protein
VETVPNYRTVILRQLANEAGWTFSWGDNTLDSVCNLQLAPFPTRAEAEKAARTFIGKQEEPHEWRIEYPIRALVRRALPAARKRLRNSPS